MARCRDHAGACVERAGRLAVLVEELQRSSRFREPCIDATRARSLFDQLRGNIHAHLGPRADKDPQREGLTVFARLGDWGVLGQVNLTVEAVVYGLVLALRLLVVTLACLLVVCAADPDELLFSFRRISPHSALTAALTTRLIPVLGADARRLAEAQRCRPDGGARGVRGKLAVLRATVAGALDRSLDVAAVLEMRGYGTARPARRSSRELSRHDLAFAAAGAVIVLIAATASASGAASFTAYPLLHLDVTWEVLALAALLILVALLPFTDRRGVER